LEGGEQKLQHGWSKTLATGWCEKGLTVTVTLQILLHFLFFNEIEVWTQGFTLAKQVLYHLSHASSLFCSGYFGEGV
jgi:hypothetical protein